MLFATWQDNPFRPTRDLDLPGQGDSDSAVVADGIRAICSVDVPDDGVAFDVAGVEAFPIRGKMNIPVCASEPARQSPGRDCPNLSDSHGDTSTANHVLLF